MQSPSLHDHISNQISGHKKVRKGRPAKRTCDHCGRANGGLYNTCNECRQNNCKHDGDTYYGSSFELNCSKCGKTLQSKKRYKKNKPGEGIGDLASLREHGVLHKHTEEEL